ncbi:MAG: imidazolonepropionase-like amidohydrolase [Halieaceae bacterium]|jgi:imidazolonepropionase-like amidohydrolase
MNRFLFAAGIAISLWLTANAAVAETTLLHAGVLLAEPGEPPLTEATIVVRDGRIEQVLEGYSPGEAFSADQVIDLSDRFVMPGFIDLHVHLSSHPTPAGRDIYVRKPDAYYALVGFQNAEKTLMAGFTTVRDLGSRGHAIFALRDAIREGLVPGPKILVAGSAITPSGGHGDFHGYREEVLEALPATGTCDGADDCMRAVRQMVKRGADVIKVTATGGVLSETSAGTGQQFTQPELDAIAATAHALGRKVTAHAHRKEGIEAALRAGFDSIEHSMWADRDTMKLFLKTGAWLIPTVYPISYVGDTPEKIKQGPFKDAPPAVMEKLLQLGSQPKDMTRLAHDMGVKIALGTDSGVSPNGENANEFVEYVNIGMSPMEALMAGTVHAAEAGGIEDVGSLVPGMAADIVAMPGNPLEAIDAVLGVDFVMRDGLVFKGAGR